MTCALWERRWQLKSRFVSKMSPGCNNSLEKTRGLVNIPRQNSIQLASLMRLLQHIVAGMIVFMPFAVFPQDTAPLPSIDTVLKRVAGRAEKEDDNDQAFAQRYHYLRIRITDYRNSEGDLKKHEVKRSEEGAPVGQVLSQTPPAAKTEAEEGSEKDEAVTETHSNVHGQAFHKKDLTLQDLVQRFQFTLAGRETINGRPALVVDFKPLNKDLPVRNFKDKFINKGAGRVWVDEADYALVKADLHLTKSVYVWGGLVGAVWKFHYSFDRERTSDGLWYPHYVNWHLEGRELFIGRIMDYHEERTDVRKVTRIVAAAH